MCPYTYYNVSASDERRLRDRSTCQSHGLFCAHSVYVEVRGSDGAEQGLALGVPVSWCNHLLS